MSTSSWSLSMLSSFDSSSSSSRIHHRRPLGGRTPWLPKAQPRLEADLLRMAGRYFVPMVRDRCCKPRGPRRTLVANYGGVSILRYNKAATSFVGKIQRQRWNTQKLQESRGRFPR
ncbi:uncharacterized protein [Arachis hypogaea]|uniref:uncharacterized protein isoform X2 n=1 Tax=Arachis hypogaea TaxID=3818 RepID=UPI003B228E0A